MQSSSMEAVMGAVLMDHGFAYAKDFVLRLFDGEIGRAFKEMIAGDHKSMLQELIQAQHQVAPVYCTIKEEGPDHAKEFTVEVIVNGSVLGVGRGKSKRIAEVEAARIALQGWPLGQ